MPSSTFLIRFHFHFCHSSFSSTYLSSTPSPTLINPFFFFYFLSLSPLSFSRFSFLSAYHSTFLCTSLCSTLLHSISKAVTPYISTSNSPFPPLPACHSSLCFTCSCSLSLPFRDFAIPSSSPSTITPPHPHCYSSLPPHLSASLPSPTASNRP